MENRNDKKLGDKGFIDRIFIPMLWMLSIVATILLTVLCLKLKEKSEKRVWVENDYIESLLSRMESHRYFLNMNIGDYTIVPADSAVIGYGLEVIQDLEEFGTLAPYKKVRDSARVMQKQYLDCFPMLKDSVRKMDLQTGDIIVRHNNAFHSDLFRKLSKGERKYSHLGVIEHFSVDSILVYHMVANDFTGIGAIESNPIYQFMPRGDFDVAIYRIDASEQQHQSIINEIKRLQNKGVPFDPLFNVSDTTKLYCAEMVAFAVNKVLKNEIITPSGVLLGKPLYTIEDCYNFPLAKCVYRRNGRISHNN